MAISRCPPRIPPAFPASETASHSGQPSCRRAAGPQSPVDFFRQLLAMTPEEREEFLTNRPPEIRDRILAKVREYLALDPDERELRLRATELRWYLLPLLRESRGPIAPRAWRRSRTDLRELVASRLEQWSILPPPLQAGIFGERTHPALLLARGFDATPRRNPAAGRPSDAEQARWNALVRR
jgi:hypothetical protein